MAGTYIDAGDLRNRVTLQTLPDFIAQNSDGGELRSDDQWQNVATVFSKIDTQGGREFFAAREVSAELTHEITIRWRAGVTPGMRVLFADPKDGTNRYFDIRAVVNPNNELRHCLLLHVRELIGRTAVS